MKDVLQDLLARTSRTFALTIPLLEEPLASQVGVAYLLFRIADTLEDEAGWDPALRAELLVEFARLLEAPEEAAVQEFLARTREVPLPENADYADLLSKIPLVLAECDPATKAGACTLHHVRRTSLGMAQSVRTYTVEGFLRLPDVRALKEYCYLVAGIVGELLTDLFLLQQPQLASVESELRGEARAFGEGLQLVNILKDAREDGASGRQFIPRDATLASLFELARRNLHSARNYVETLREGGASRGVLAFTALPVLLAEEALAAVEARGSGAKVSRERVMWITENLHRSLDAGLLP